MKERIEIYDVMVNGKRKWHWRRVVEDHGPFDSDHEARDAAEAARIVAEDEKKTTVLGA